MQTREKIKIESRIDVAFCLLRAARLKRSIRIGDIRVRYKNEKSYYKRETFEESDIMPFLINALLDSKEYKNVLSQRL